MLRAPLLAAAALTLLAAAPAGAASRVPRPPMALPGQASIAVAQAERDTWILGARPAGRAARILREAGGRRAGPSGWEVPRERARETARRLGRRDLLTYAEPNRLSTLRQAPPRAVPNDPYSERVPWRDRAVDPSLPPPPVTADSPVLALVDAKADTSHPEFASGTLTALPGERLEISHGTATAAVAAAPQNGIGMVGVWPGMRALNVPLPADRISCADSARGITRAVQAGASVINMSYGSGSFCQAEYEALQYAVSRQANLVAAAGNEFAMGNPLEFPASLPHVLTVGAMRPDDRPAYFSNENAAVDLVAPGVGIVTAVPRALDADGTRDGYEIVDGTSFSAPMVAAATAWVRQVRPELTFDQVSQVVRLSARDIATAGYDTSSGFGALDVAAALTKTPPTADPGEPNEDMRFVDGRAFGRPQKPIWKGRGATSLVALLDRYEDPGDVYRVRVPPGRKVRVAVKPRFGNPDLELYHRKARSVGQRKRRLRSSRRPAERTDKVRWRNRSRRTRTAFVRVWIRDGQRSLDAGYTLSVR